MVVHRGGVDLDGEAADLFARPGDHESLLVAARFERTQFREMITTRRPRNRFLPRLRGAATKCFFAGGGIKAPQHHVLGYVGRRRCELDYPPVTSGIVVIPRGVRKRFENAIRRIPGPDLLVARSVFFVSASAEDHLSGC